ncbi:GNAT family N-acetyltransferase [Wenxinia saemankumensis]|uniref:Acetyltransferase (GNAT) family protein n=1 Tax=Wenxinia saemankumensis TaxID=1447782 RepID=A0A1M6ALY8_9RHOB|nr:GNAT family N-acetyltransferase [Wenxinia saemankumensis]SHI37233.1 Acetyltransferase (GNAT) family protein [Wenxinia saemankumensis]
MSPRLRPARPEDDDWILSEHRRHYAEVEGFDAGFGAAVASALADFRAAPQAARQAAWLAVEGTARLGCLFCTEAGPDTARLRLFYVAPAARGTGLAGDLLDAAERFAAGAGFARLAVSTYSAHAAACALYARRGMAVTARTPERAFGRDLVRLDFAAMLDAPPAGR